MYYYWDHNKPLKHNTYLVVLCLINLNAMGFIRPANKNTTNLQKQVIEQPDHWKKNKSGLNFKKFGIQMVRSIQFPTAPSIKSNLLFQIRACTKSFSQLTLVFVSDTSSYQKLSKRMSSGEIIFTDLISSSSLSTLKTW